MASAVQDRFLGAIVGSAVGDALGAGGQGLTASAIRKQKGVPDATTAEPGAATELSSMWVRSLAERGSLDLSDAAGRLLAYKKAGGTPPDDVAAAAIRALEGGAAPQDAGLLALETPGVLPATAGSVIACTPVGLFHAAELRGLAEDAAAMSRLTHVDPRCVSACRAVAMAVARIVRGETDDVLERAALVASASPVVRDAITAAEDADVKKLPLDGPDAGSAALAVEAAFAVYENAASFEKGLRAVVERGGAARADGAVAGALLGARFGLSGIPPRWVDGLSARARVLEGAAALWQRVYGKPLE